MWHRRRRDRLWLHRKIEPFASSSELLLLYSMHAVFSGRVCSLLALHRFVCINLNMYVISKDCFSLCREALCQQMVKLCPAGISRFPYHGVDDVSYWLRLSSLTYSQTALSTPINSSALSSTVKCRIPYQAMRLSASALDGSDVSLGDD